MDTTDPEQIAIAIEVNHGAVVEALLAKGLRVYSINPKLLDRLRDRFSMPGAKDDRRDAFVLASCVESDAQAFRRIEVGNEENTRLQAATRLREDLKPICERTPIDSGTSCESIDPPF